MKRSEYQARAEVFRARLAQEAARPRDEQQWPDLEQWPALPVTATCRTGGCPAQGRAYRVRLRENADGVYRAACAGCSRDHTELVAVFDDTGPVNLATPAPAVGGRRAARTAASDPLVGAEHGHEAGTDHGEGL